jgi:hypothetical protein
LVAAIAAAGAGASVVLLERLPRVGKKLLATGNGRCNYTNRALSPACFHGSRRDFPLDALSHFPAEAALEFFAGLGIDPVTEEGGKVYPRSGQASSVLDALRWEVERLGVEVRTEAEVHRLVPLPGGFRVEHGRGESLRAQRVVLAAGGRAAPHLGSNGSGYGLATALGHRLVTPFPALTKLVLGVPFLKRLKGVKVEGTITLEADGAPLRVEQGEVLFTERGISGPPVLQVSRAAGESLRQGRTVRAVLDLVPDLSSRDLEEHLRRRFTLLAHRGLEAGLVGFLNRRLIPVALDAAGLLDHAIPCSPSAAAPLSALLKGWPLPVSGLESWTEAQATAGGIDTADVDPATMASLLVPGLFLAGEILDVDGDCGGFNLHWAWASGRLAGLGAAG